MELFDYLNDEDKITIKEFIQAYANIEEVDIYKALKYWNKNKRKMFKALGRNLRVKIPVDIPCDDKLFINALQDIYIPPFGYQIEGKVNHPLFQTLKILLVIKSYKKFQICGNKAILKISSCRCLGMITLNLVS